MIEIFRELRERLYDHQVHVIAISFQLESLVFILFFLAKCIHFCAQLNRSLDEFLVHLDDNQFFVANLSLKLVEHLLQSFLNRFLFDLVPNE